MSIEKNIRLRTVRRTFRVRNKIVGDRPRVCVHRSNRHISAQIIDDKQGKTLVAFSSLELKAALTNKDVAHQVGVELGKRAVALSIGDVKFDRGHKLYHGRVKALADGLRESGLNF